MSSDVRGFTRHPNSAVPPEKRGTYAGLIERIPLAGHFLLIAQSETFLFGVNFMVK